MLVSITAVSAAQPLDGAIPLFLFGIMASTAVDGTGMTGEQVAQGSLRRPCCTGSGCAQARVFEQTIDVMLCVLHGFSAT